MKPPISQRTNAPVREVICVYGGPKQGKSTGWINIAEYAVKTHKPDSGDRLPQFYVIDTDGDAADRSLSSKPDLANVHVYKARNWEEFRDASSVVFKLQEQGDWVIVDLADRVWRFVQNYYSQQVFGGADPDTFDEAEYLLKLRAEWEGTKAGSAPRTPIDGWDYGYVNSLYDGRMTKLLMESDAHVYITTEMADFDPKLEKDKTKRAMFGAVGTKMTGQKSLPYQVATILYIETMAGQRTLTTIGDRDGPSGPRTSLKQASLTDFPNTYLVDVAGWTLL